jgi:hypothetical protein
VPAEPLHTYGPHPEPALPCGNVVHAPLADAPSAEHTSQPPEHEALQQNASEQLLLEHSAAPAQPCPFFLRQVPLALAPAVGRARHVLRAVGPRSASGETHVGVEHL